MLLACLGEIFFVLFQIFLYYMFERSTCTYVCVCITWVPGALESEEGILYPGIGVTVVVSPIWVLGPKHGQLQQEQVLLNTELSLQPQCYMRWSLMNFECDSGPTRFELSTSIIVILACVSTAYDAHNDKTIKEFPNKNPHFKWCVVVSNCAFVCLFVAMWNVKTPSTDSNWQSNL